MRRISRVKGLIGSEPGGESSGNGSRVSGAYDRKSVNRASTSGAASRSRPLTASRTASAAMTVSTLQNANNPHGRGSRPSDELQVYLAESKL